MISIMNKIRAVVMKYDAPQVPSAGDWSFHRDAAIFVEGAETVTVEDCLLDSPGNIAYRDPCRLA